jgi:hypothetical protein
MTRLGLDALAPVPERCLIGTWSIETLAASRGMAAVDRFDGAITLQFRFGPEAVSWPNPRTLHLWSLDESEGEWADASGRKLDHRGIVSAKVNYLRLCCRSRTALNPSHKYRGTAPEKEMPKQNQLAHSSLSQSEERLKEASTLMLRECWSPGLQRRRALIPTCRRTPARRAPTWQTD